MPSARTMRIMRTASAAALMVAAAGLVAAVAIGLFLWIGQPWGTINDLALLVMTLALAPLMLAFYELGGLTPTPLAQAAQTTGWIAVMAWCAIQALMIAGVVTFDYNRAATGAFALETVMSLIIGAWVAGANLLAGPWLGQVRWLGVVGGLGWVVLGGGLLVGGINHPLTYLGGIGYSIVSPVWAFLMSRELRGTTRLTDG